MEPFLGEIKMFGGNFAPKNYASCNGQIMAISQNTALFSLLGTNYGGNGTTTFGLPNLQGRMPMHYRTGPGPAVPLGAQVGQASVSLIAPQCAAHTHTMTATMNVVTAAGTARTPQDGYIAGDAGGDANFAPGTATPDAALAPGAITFQVASAGSGQALPTQSPSLGVNFIIALQGVYPSRN
jgi:microcystin-dependent protein